MEFFSSQKITNHITRIYLPGDVQAYLVEGTDKAVLIDTGCGIGDFKAYVYTLTGKPLTVLLTHGHLDHAPGAIQFDTVYMNRKDREIYTEHDQIQQRIDYVETTSSAGKYKREDLLPESSPDRFLDLQDGMRFDLGGYHITTYACPGHTPGSMVFLMEEDRILLLGDACNPFTFLFDSTCLGVSSDEESLKKLLSKVEGRYDQVLLSHEAGGIPSTNMIQDNIAVCEAIKMGNTDNIHYEFMGRKALLAFNPGVRNKHGQIEGNIVYNPDRIDE